MGTYISHFRIAEALLTELKYLDTEGFLFGSLAPDAGIPNQDWSQFDPPRVVTHFLCADTEEEKIADLEFYRQYMKGLNKDKETDIHKYSFLLGYFIHLVCDNLWLLWIIEASTTYYDAMIREKGREAWGLMRHDWHDLDRKYIRDNANSKVWQKLKSLDAPPAYLAYLPPKAMIQQINYIEDVYLQPAKDRELDRKYHYLNEATMDRFVEQSTQVVLEILKQKEKLKRSASQTALSLLQSEKLLPFEYPISDI